MSTATTPEQAIVKLYVAFFQKELEQVAKDKAWIADNITDPDKREKRLSYQEWREQQLSLLLALTTAL